MQVWRRRRKVMTSMLTCKTQEKTVWSEAVDDATEERKREKHEENE